MVRGARNRDDRGRDAGRSRARHRRRSSRGFPGALALLRERPGLLVLDNLETPWAPAAERGAVEDTLARLAAVPGVALLASFRGRERVAGPSWARVHAVEHLPPPFDAELFRRIAQDPFDGDPDFSRFVAALEGIPLAIELVATRAHGLRRLAPLWKRWREIGVSSPAIPPSPRAG